MIDLITIAAAIYLSYNRPEGIPSYTEWQIPKGFPSYFYVILFAFVQWLTLPTFLPDEGIGYFTLILILLWQLFVYDCMIYILWGRFRFGF